MKKRHLMLVGGLLLVSCDGGAPDAPLVCATPADRDMAADVVVTAENATVSATPGEPVFDAWTFDGDVPGPVWRLGVGQVLAVKLLNSSLRASSLHFMGLDYDVTDDGTPDFSQSVVAPGCAHVYRVAATEPGAWPFVNHVEPGLSLPRGQYGAVIVPGVSERPAAHEFVIFAGQLGVEAKGQGEEDDANETPFHMTFNGRVFPSSLVIELSGDHYARRPDSVPTAKVGELVRWRIINVSPDATHTFGIHGHQFCDQGGVEDPVKGCPNGGHVTNIVDVSPLKAATVEFIESAPGRWMFHCHLLDHVTDGMLGFYEVAP